MFVTVKVYEYCPLPLVLAFVKVSTVPVGALMPLQL